MTLILNEIHLRHGFSDTFQIAAADRRIIRDGKVENPRRKLFAIPYIKSTVSYYGRASFVNDKGKEVYFSEWLPAFIRDNNNITSLEEFSKALQSALSSTISYEQKIDSPSGFHLSGYSRGDGLPEFWGFSNLTNSMDSEGNYKKPFKNYGEPTSDFLERDARNPEIHWDGVNPSSAGNALQIYRNGDIRTHVLASEALDFTMKNIMNLSGFKKADTIENYADYVKFKFEFLSYLYKNWARSQIISRPIDVIILTKSGLKEKSKGKWMKK
jgi:hypothetical protein